MGLFGKKNTQELVFSIEGANRPGGILRSSVMVSTARML